MTTISPSVAQISGSWCSKSCFTSERLFLLIDVSLLQLLSNDGKKIWLWRSVTLDHRCAHFSPSRCSRLIYLLGNYKQRHTFPVFYTVCMKTKKKNHLWLVLNEGIRIVFDVFAFVNSFSTSPLLHRSCEFPLCTKEFLIYSPLRSHWQTSAPCSHVVSEVHYVKCRLGVRELHHGRYGRIKVLEHKK